MECTVCAEVSEYFGLPECEHSGICSLCWYRMTTMFKTSQCPVCRNECRSIFILSNLGLRFEEINAARRGDQFRGFFKDTLSGMFFESKVELGRLAAFKKIICLICKSEMRNLAEYKNHAKNMHDKVLCEQCAQSSKLFPSEQSLFGAVELTNHKNNLHKKCNVCGNYFYDSINLVAHIKQAHDSCEFCPFEERIAFADNQSLEKHYIENHYLCNQFECRRLNCFVFVKYEDLQDHFMNEHPNQPVPNPALGFKVSGAEERPAYEDSSITRNKGPEFHKQSNDIKGLDLSKSISKQINPYPQPAFPPQSQLRDQTLFREDVKVSQVLEKPKVQIQFYDNLRINKSPPKASIIDVNISRLNNGNIDEEEFVSNVRSSIDILDEDMIRKLRTEINSNISSEFIVYQLAANLKYSYLMDKKNNDAEWKEEKAPVQRFNQSINQSKIKNEIQNKDITTSNTIQQYINLLNTGVINESEFIECFKDFLNEDQIQLAIEIISANLNSNHNLNSICTQLQGLFGEKNYRGNYNGNSNRSSFGNSLSQKFNNESSFNFSEASDWAPSDNEEKAKIKENLIENLDLYNSKLLSLTEFVRGFADVIKPEMREFILEVIIKNSSDSRVITDRLRDMFAKANSRESRSIAYDRRGRRGVGRNDRYREL